MTARVVTKDDFEHVLAVVRNEMLKGSVDKERAKQFARVVLFGAFTGQRPYSTTAQLRVEQFRVTLPPEIFTNLLGSEAM